MMKHSPRTRPGFTLVEVIIALVLTAVMGALLTGLFVNQSRFFDQQEKLGGARAVSRGAMTIMMSELRMMDADSGVVLANDSTLTFRIPYAMGVVCGGTLSTVVNLVPVDSVIYATAGFTGWAHRPDSTYRYIETLAVPTTGGATVCINNDIDTIPGGRFVQLTPVELGARVGTPAILFQRVTYEFRNSAAYPGKRGLFRRVVTPNTYEELVSPFDEDARFRFFVLNADTAQDAPPSPLSQLRGVELVLTGESHRPNADNGHDLTYANTAVFFMNRR